MKKRRYVVNLLLSLLVAFGGLAAVVFTKTSPRLGLDLEGGISVTLSASGEGAEDEGVLDQTAQVIRQRIDALGVAEPEVSVAPEDRLIFIQLPGVEDEKKALEIIGQTAQLTFREVLREVAADAKNAPEVTKEVGPEVQDEKVVYPVKGQQRTLMELGPARLTGDVVTEAEAVVDT